MTLIADTDKGALRAQLAPMPHHKAGLQWTASGYGARIPAQYLVKYAGRWRRVYCYAYSNSSTMFIGKRIDDPAAVIISDIY